LPANGRNQFLDATQPHRAVFPKMPIQLLECKRNVAQKLPLPLHNAKETEGPENLKIPGKLDRREFPDETASRYAQKLPG
jgi:hypothetical protein